MANSMPTSIIPVMTLAWIFFCHNLLLYFSSLNSLNWANVFVLPISNKVLVIICVCSLILVLSHPLRPMDCSPAGSLSDSPYWNGLPCHSPEDLSEPGIKPASSESLYYRWILCPLRYLGICTRKNSFQMNKWMYTKEFQMVTTKAMSMKKLIVF